MIEALVYLLAITLAELVTAFYITVQPVWGITLHILILVAIILRSALASQPARQQFYLSLALAPLVRVISLTMPLANIPRLMWYPIIYAPLMVAAIVVARIMNINAKDLGVSPRLLPVKLTVSLPGIPFHPVLALPAPLLQVAIALTGFIFGVAEHFILQEKSIIDRLTLETIWLPALVLLFSTGVVEEFIFRGVMQQTAWREFGWWGIIYVSFLFAILHLGFLNWIDIIFVFAVALLFAWIVKRTGSLLGVTLAHGITNIVLYLVAPFFF
ncbi:MAG: amino terminal protease [Dehalococcoidales bacterium]|nr:amino terminal protease [Dehalococcoidales bacterium]